MLSAIMLSVTYKHFTLSVVMLNVIMLSVVMLNVVAPSQRVWKTLKHTFDSRRNFINVQGILTEVEASVQSTSFYQPVEIIRL